MSEEIKLSAEDFAVIAQCAIRYCHGRQTYMPNMVRGIVRPHLKELADLDIARLRRDAEDQVWFGNEQIDKPGWLQWRKELEDEWNRRMTAIDNGEI